MPDFEYGSLPRRWTPASSDCTGVPDFHVHAYTPAFFILRQSGCTHFEKPFLYLILGSREAMLIDTGAGNADVAGAVARILARDAERRQGPELPLLVVHSHGHSDHVAGDAAFSANRAVRVVEATQASVQAFFGIRAWPDAAGAYDLGDRVLDAFPIPGHGPASVAIYDRRTGILLTGDVLYPGRASVDRLVAFTATHDVTHVLGCHIENTSTPYVDYPEGTTFQPDEHALELGRAHLLELQAALRDMQGPIERRALRDFTIWPVRE
jgi:glyoxylase-like metal-dependent hydrolase (beta-lactamase superfamily II)